MGVTALHALHAAHAHHRDREDQTAAMCRLPCAALPVWYQYVPSTIDPTASA
jgi:hypothetical protein